MRGHSNSRGVWIVEEETLMHQHPKQAWVLESKIFLIKIEPQRIVQTKLTYTESCKCLTFHKECQTYADDNVIVKKFPLKSRTRQRYHHYYLTVFWNFRPLSILLPNYSLHLSVSLHSPQHHQAVIIYYQLLTNLPVFTLSLLSSILQL